MANRIKGITVEIGGDTTKLQTVLKGVDSEIRNTQAQADSSSAAVQEIGASGDKLQALGGNISSVGQKFLPVTGAVTALGAAAVKAAAEAMNYMAMAGWEKRGYAFGY